VLAVPVTAALKIVLDSIPATRPIALMMGTRVASGTA
jgi:hypothetical protein